MTNRLIAGLLSAGLVMMTMSVRPAGAATDPAQTAAKAAIKCQGTILKGGAKFVKTKLSKLQGCVGSILGCIETKAGTPKCLATSRKKCTGAFASILNAEGGFAKALAGACTSVSAASLSAGDLGYQVDAGECLKNFGADVGTVDGLVTCIVREHARTAEQLFALQQARTVQLLKKAGVSTTTLCDVPTNPDCDGCEVTPPTSGKAVVSCAATVAKAGATFLQKTIAVVAKCTKATFACAVTPVSAKTAACNTKATQTCTTAFGTLMAARDALRTKIETDTSCTAVPFGVLADASALNLGVLGPSCAAVGASGTVDTLAAYAECIRQQHECGVQSLAPFAAPRLAELLASAGLTNPLCPQSAALTAETLGAPIRAAVAEATSGEAASADTVDVSTIIRAITSPGSGAQGTFTAGGMKVSTAGASNSVTGVSGDVTFQQPKPQVTPKPIKIAYTRCGDTTVTPTLIVSANGANDAILPGFFALPLPKPATDQGDTEITVTFQPAVQSCVRLAFATDCGTGGVSPYVQFEQVPAIVPEQAPTPTPTPALDACALALQNANRTYLGATLTNLTACSDAIFTCVQTQPGDASCLATATTSCTSDQASITAAQNAAIQAIVTPCVSAAASDLLSTDGLGYSNLTDECTTLLSGIPPTDLSTIAVCVLTEHLCDAHRLLDAEMPRADEMFNLAGVDLDPFCIENLTSGGGGNVGDPTAAAALEQCTAAIGAASGQFVDAALQRIGGCADAVFKCVQDSPGDASCLTQAQASCASAVSQINVAEASFASAIVAQCGAVPFSDVVSLSGAGVGALAANCQAVSVPSLGSLSDYGQCLVRQHLCQVIDSIRFETPRAAELLGLVGLQPPSFCP